MISIQTPQWLEFFGSDFSEKFPFDWKKQVSALIQSSSKSTVLDGASETSREKLGTRIPVRIVEGKAIARDLPWLVRLYEHDFLQFASDSFGKQLFVCNETNDAININCIEGVAARYEWHVDTNPVTGILFVETFDKSDGGALIFRKQGEEFRFQPRSGWFCCFAAQDVEHAVEPLLASTMRTSIPMNYYVDRTNTGRDPTLNAYLYKEYK